MFFEQEEGLSYSQPLILGVMGCSSSKNISTTGPEPEQPTLAKASSSALHLSCTLVDHMFYAEIVSVRRHLALARVTRLELQR